MISGVIPGADSSAGERRLVRMAALLSDRAPVDLVAAGTGRPADEAARVQALRDAGVHVPFGGGPVHLVRLLMGRRYAFILAESWEVAEPALALVRRYQPEAVFAVDTVDLHFLRDARAAELTGTADPGHERTMARELSTYHGADVRIFVSEVERALYTGLPGSVSERNVVIPIIVELPSRARDPRPGEVVFVGGLWHPPNWDGVFWFCSAVWPRIRAAVPEARLRLIGSNAWSLPIDTDTLAECPGVVVEGFVADLDAAYAEASAVVAPLRFGAGMKGKVCEAMAAGVPVVTTTVGAEGIAAQPGRDLLVADGPDDFADAVTALLADAERAASVGSAGAAAIHAQCGVDVVRPAVQGLVTGLESARPAQSRRAAPSPRTRQLPRHAAALGWRVGRRLHALVARSSPLRPGASTGGGTRFRRHR